jgi:hypothetical protein
MLKLSCLLLFLVSTQITSFVYGASGNIRRCFGFLKLNVNLTIKKKFDIPDCSRPSIKIIALFLSIIGVDTTFLAVWATCRQIVSYYLAGCLTHFIFDNNTKSEICRSSESLVELNCFAEKALLMRNQLPNDTVISCILPHSPSFCITLQNERYVVSV